MSKSEFEFHLNTHILFAGKSGDQEEGHTLILKEPTARNMAERAVLKQQFMTIIEWIQSKATADESSAPEANAEEASPEETEEFADAVSQALYFAEGIDYKAMLGSFRSLMVEAKCCVVEDEKPLTSSLWDKIRPDDIDRMIGHYLVNFLLPS